MSHGDRYLRILCILLLGYALMGKGFAYLGVAPLYVGEATMLYGIVALFFSDNWSRILRTAWLWPLFALMAWGALRTVPYLDTYGVDALHDAAVWIWGLFAIVIASLLAAEPARLLFLERKFRVFAKWLLIVGPISYCITIFANPHLPNAFWADQPYVLVKGGDLVVQLTGIFAFAVLLGGLETAFVVPMMILNLILYFTGRAAMVTFCTGTAIVTRMRPDRRSPGACFPRWWPVWHCSGSSTFTFRPPARNRAVTSRPTRSSRTSRASSPIQTTKILPAAKSGGCSGGTRLSTTPSTANISGKAKASASTWPTMTASRLKSITACATRTMDT